MTTYKIVRFYQEDETPNREIAHGLTLEEAQDWCNDPDTRGDGFFDGYYRESEGDE